MASAGDEDDADLKLVRASGSLLADLEKSLPRLLWRPSTSGASHGRIHTQARRRDVHFITSLIEPFQGDPQLLDSKLKLILPPIVEAYLEHLSLGFQKPSNNNLDLETSICTILYTLCKVRGNKVVVGFFNNEPRYLELVLQAVERTIKGPEEDQAEWQVPYVLLLWLSHLLLTPFDLSTISTDGHTRGLDPFSASLTLPSLTKRALSVGMHYLPVATKAQDAAAAMLVRLATRPDMQRLQLADAIVEKALETVNSKDDGETTIYQRLGPLRFLAGIVTSADLSHLVPRIYKMCESLSADDVATATSTNAVTKKVMLKIFRNVAIVSLRSASASGPLLSFLETTSVLEDVIDHLLRSLGDRDTPVRYAAAKAISLIVQELDSDMGHEVIQAVLDTFKEDMPRSGAVLDFRTANPLKWHGLTLALSHALFKRTASPTQLPDIVNALFAALQFQQRTATGSFVGANVRDAANFGIWSLSRRYTTDELLAVDSATLSSVSLTTDRISIIQALAIQLILSACMDPEGNIRRGSSAALQELVGRHPNQVHEGISLVQIVDYQAVGLRRRAIVDVARRTAELHIMYWQSIVDGLFGWRGLGSPDVVSREAVALSIAKMSHATHAIDPSSIIERVMIQLGSCTPGDVEKLHGLTLTAAYIVEAALHESDFHRPNSLASHVKGQLSSLWSILRVLRSPIEDSTVRVFRAEVPMAVARLISALALLAVRNASEPGSIRDLPIEHVNTLVQRLLTRHEETILSNVLPLVRSLRSLEQTFGIKLSCIELEILCREVSSDASRGIVHGAGKAVALGALAVNYGTGLSEDMSLQAVRTLTGLMDSTNIDWRVVGIRSLQTTVESLSGSQREKEIVSNICMAVHRGLKDHTVDDRGDIGSLVRLQAIACLTAIFTKEHADLRLDALSFGSNALLFSSDMLLLQTDIVLMSFEKLDRVRMQAAQCRQRFLSTNSATAGDHPDVSTPRYFDIALSPLQDKNTKPEIRSAILEGCMSCAGAGAESLVQASRTSLVNQLASIDDEHLAELLTEYNKILNGMLLSSSNMQPALELLAFLFDMQIPQRLENFDFKWRNLLSTVQKSHHKSNDIPKILAATGVYLGMVNIPPIRNEVIKRLVGMLRTNPYPNVRAGVAEALLLETRDQSLTTLNWTKSASKQGNIVETLHQKYVVV